MATVPDGVDEDSGMEKEINRLATFPQRWPHIDKGYPSKLAVLGFFWKVNQLVCVFCKITVQYWNSYQEVEKMHRPCCSTNRQSVNVSFGSPSDLDVGTLPEEFRWLVTSDSNRTQPSENPPDTVSDHSSTVPIISSQDQTDGAIDQDQLITRMKHERLRLDSFQNWPCDFLEPADLARAGFFYTGKGDRVQCAFCQGILCHWDDGDDPSDEHEDKFPRCPFVRDYDVGNISISSQSRATSLSDMPLSYTHTRPKHQLDEACAAGDQTAREFRGARHPEFSSEESRLASYSAWPENSYVTPAQLAEAGFYYTGHGDSVRCFYCDGGLLNWAHGDNPLTEHRRWFANCKFLKDMLSKPEDNEPSDDNLKCSVLETGAHSSGGNVNDLSRLVQARMDSDEVRRVLDIGFSVDLIKSVIEERLRTTGQDYTSSAALSEAVLDQMEVEQSSSNEVEPTRTASMPASPASSVKNRLGEEKAASMPPLVEHEQSKDEVTKKLLEENRQLKESRVCKICMDEEASVVFMPCGHLVCCSNCVEPLRKCPICRTVIRGKVRAYIA